MKPTSSLATLFLLAVSTSATPAFEKRAQCQASLDVATAVAARLQSRYYNPPNGDYSGVRWTDANNIENVHNLMLATGSDQWSTLGDDSYIGRLALLQHNAGINQWASYVDGSWDDSLWIVLALWKIADYKAARGRDNAAFIESGMTLYNMVQASWDNTCGGGVWWSSANGYKNSITNELFLLVSAVGAINFPGNSAFLTNALNARNWIKNSGLRNAQGLFNDGLNSECGNNGGTVWIYNQGVIAAGLGALYATTRDESLIVDAEITLDAAIATLTSGGILKEICDDAASSRCNDDQHAFKGIFMRMLQYYLDRVNDPARTAKYSGFIHAQASGVYHYGTNGENDIGSVWYAPSAGGSIFSSTSSGSGLAAHVVNAKYGPCDAPL
ncbi:Six-hairpin glycosidase [Mycena indigotica]|uniref:Six-hairpin glycosidase n=1 Tax=Mycena indigotica TaxID=2126181 RepID=A0A8H6T2T1_9AGAR|nr:Six-hairpin glycosidase [Mycena indigotica]KAF7309996.1 Six-hairpin glycosidase [Mycena indigotica]